MHLIVQKHPAGNIPGTISCGPSQSCLTGSHWRLFTPVPCALCLILCTFFTLICAGLQWALGRAYRVHHSLCKTYPKSCFSSVQIGWYKPSLPYSEFVYMSWHSLSYNRVWRPVHLWHMWLLTLVVCLHELLHFTQALIMISVFCYYAPLVSFCSVLFFAGHNGLCHIQDVLLFHQALHLLLFSSLTFLTHTCHYSCSHCASRRQRAKIENR